ncbi:tyrosine-type recombinase/integrase [Acinetobacter bereziniae]|uniref:tyrosine-type recombinase/integrase n=1 Tax=Acinetobacter bereziniae TaxID=106648 RepID=UPI0019077F1D|nr:site-specific integrase [Acinetobacter bereziniae]QQC84654.1 site-specific integrase [Acinetobacter bereziniae]
MATFQKRNGRVTATVRIKPHPPKTKTFDTLRDAKAWAQALEVQFKNEKAQNFEHILLKDALIEYRDTSSVLKKGAKQEVNRINYILKHMDCNRSLLKVDKQFLVAWRELRLENTKGSTVRRELLMLAGFFTWCVETKLWLSKNPVKEIKLPPVSPHRERVISNDEIEMLLPYLNSELKDIFVIALETGMRQSEICNLTWNRVFLDKKYLLLDVTKNGRKREVPLSKTALEILKAKKIKNMKKVFNYLPSYVSADFMKARVEAGLFDFTFHDARHTAATRIALKIQVLDLCKMFGWTDPKRAMIYYNPTASEIAERL